MAKICSIHNVEADWKTGVSKTKKNSDGTPKNYAFWACPQRLPDGGYCQAEVVDGEGVNPKTVAEFENSLKDDRSRRIERQHSQEMAIRFLELANKQGLLEVDSKTDLLAKVIDMTAWFAKDLET